MRLASPWRHLWIVWVFVIALVATMPWTDFVGHSHWGMVRWIPFQDASLTLRSLRDILRNILLFLPLGYLYVRFRPGLGSGAVLRVVLFAALLSAGAELYQVFSHNRIPSATDFSTNVIGAAIGAAVAMRLVRN